MGSFVLTLLHIEKGRQGIEMNAEVFKFKPKAVAERESEVSTNIGKRQHHNTNVASTQYHHPKPLVRYAVIGLNKALRDLGTTILLPEKLEQKLADPDYRMSEECPRIDLLEKWERAFLLYGLIENVHDGWVGDHADEFFSEHYRGNEALFLPLQLIGDVGFAQYLSKSAIDMYQRLSLDRGMSLTEGGLSPYSYLEKFRLVRRNMYCRQYRISGVKTLKEHIAYCDYFALTAKIKRTLRSDNQLVFAMTQDVIAYNPGKFQ